MLAISAGQIYLYLSNLRYAKVTSVTLWKHSIPALRKVVRKDISLAFFCASAEMECNALSDVVLYERPAKVRWPVFTECSLREFLALRFKLYLPITTVVPMNWFDFSERQVLL